MRHFGCNRNFHSKTTQWWCQERDVDMVYLAEQKYPEDHGRVQSQRYHYLYKWELWMISSWSTNNWRIWSSRSKSGMFASEDSIMTDRGIMTHGRVFCLLWGVSWPIVESFVYCHELSFFFIELELSFLYWHSSYTECFSYALQLRQMWPTTVWVIICIVIIHVFYEKIV